MELSRRGTQQNDGDWMRWVPGLLTLRSYNHPGFDTTSWPAS